MEIIEAEAGQELNALRNRLPKWSGWLASLVLDKSGNHKGADRTSKSIGNETDLKLLLTLRSHADVIVTTGKTARSENYAASRFAPITFLTKDPNSLKEIRAFREPGKFPNRVFGKENQQTLFRTLYDEFEAEGIDAVLYEGGPSLIANLLEQLGSLRLVLTIANLDDPAAISPLKYLTGLGLCQANQEILDDFAIGTNRVTCWLISR
ncbi:MAG: hypothetical protein RI927_544 [Actinomycetota bacterium]